MLILLLLFLGWMGWFVVGALTARPAILVDYETQVINLAADRQPPGENGWPALIAVLDEFKQIGTPDVPDWPGDEREVARIAGLTGVIQGPFDAQRLRFELLYLEQIRRSGALERLDELAAAPRFVRPSRGAERADDSLSRLGDIRSVIKARRAAMRVAAEASDWKEFVRAYRHLLGLARATAADPARPNYLVGCSSVAAAIDELGHIVVEHAINEDVGRELLAATDEQAQLQPLSVIFECERLRLHDLVQRTHSDDGRGGGMLLVSEIEDPRGHSSVPAPRMLGNLRGLVQAGRAETTRLLDEYVDAAIEQSTLTREERRSHSVDLGARANSFAPHRYAFLSHALPVVEGVLDARDQVESLMGAARLLLALEMYQARHGRLPESLALAAAELPAELPIDAASCRPFALLKREPSADDPRTFLLYSLGADGEDNGGAMPPLNEWGRRPSALSGRERSRGYDHVFNRLREPVSEE